MHSLDFSLCLTNSLNRTADLTPLCHVAQYTVAQATGKTDFNRQNRSFRTRRLWLSSFTIMKCLYIVSSALTKTTVCYTAPIASPEPFRSKLLSVPPSNPCLSNRLTTTEFRTLGILSTKGILTYSSSYSLGQLLQGPIGKLAPTGTFGHGLAQPR